MFNDYYTVNVETDQEKFTIHKRYKIIRKIGSGSYGSVCSAINTVTNQVVAIKKCRNIFDKKLTTKRCLREIKLLQHFNGHPRIIDLIHVDIVNPRTFNDLYLIQTCCDTTMSDIIRSSLQLEHVHYQWFMYQLFSGLKYIHSANVIHRDLKPENILVNENCDIRICDFGMARGFASNPVESNMTHYVVTRWYRAPEIMISRNTYNTSIDMWSLGCIFAELLDRKVLFKGSDYVDQLHKIIGILGLPEDISFWDSSSSVTEYIRNLRDEHGQPPPKDPIDFSLLFPYAPSEATHLLHNLICLDPSERFTASQALEHPFVASVRDPSEEIECCNTFDFENFEMIESNHVLRQCIIEEVMTSKGIDYKQSSWSSSSSRRYTGSSISTPSSAVAAESNLNALNRVQQGKDVDMIDSEQHVMVMSDKPLVGEPEDMDEDDIREISEVLKRTVVSSESLHNIRSIERQLSKDW